MKSEDPTPKGRYSWRPNNAFWFNTRAYSQSEPSYLGGGFHSTSGFQSQSEVPPLVNAMPRWRSQVIGNAFVVLVAPRKPQLEAIARAAEEAIWVELGESRGVRCEAWCGK